MIRGFSKRNLRRLANKEINNMYEQLKEAEIYIKQNNSDQSSEEDNVDKLQENQSVTVNEDDIKKHLKSLKSKINSFESKMDIIMRQQAETLTLLKHILHNKVRIKPSRDSDFPIRSPKELERVNEAIKNSKSIEPYVETIQHQLGAKGLAKNFERIFDMSLILDMNFDGIRDKIALKPYTHLIECIFEAVKQEGDHLDDFLKSLRTAIRLNKNKYFKKRSVEKKKNSIFLDEKNVFNR